MIYLGLDLLTNTDMLLMVENKLLEVEHVILFIDMRKLITNT